MQIHFKTACMPVKASYMKGTASQPAWEFEHNSMYAELPVKTIVYGIPTSYGIMSLNRSKAFPKSCSGNKSSLRTNIRPLIKPVSNSCAHR